jgi:hypothetical protein
MHHAYYIEGPLAQFEAYKKELKPFWAKRFERFGIDESRKLIELASLKNFDKATFLIGAASLTTEAQQALLKLFEEPQRGTTFVLLVPHGSIIATLRSRMLAYPNQGEALPYVARPRLATQFLKSTQKERSAQIAVILKDNEGAREQVREFLNELEKALYSNKLSRLNLDGRKGLEDIVKVRSYVGDRAPSLKMLLEHLALSLPILK